MEDKIMKLRQYVQFDFCTVNELYVLQLFEKEDCANDGVDCIWEDDHIDFEALFERAIAWCEDKYGNLTCIGGNDMERGSELVSIVVEADTTRKLNKMAEFLIKNRRSCPLPDEADIEYEKECVGFGESGCSECLLRNIDKLT